MNPRYIETSEHAANTVLKMRSNTKASDLFALINRITSLGRVLPKDILNNSEARQELLATAQKLSVAFETPGVLSSRLDAW